MQEKKQKNTEISARILQIIENQGITPNLFAKNLGYDRSQTVYDVINGKSAPSYDFFRRFEISEYSENINISWLIAGNGKMIRDNVDKGSLKPGEAIKNNDEVVPKSIKTESGKGIPLIPIDAMAGYMSGESQAMEYECEHYVIPMFHEAEFLIPVKGSSMQPKYNSGDVAACKKLSLSDIFFQWHKVYVLDTAQGALIKRIEPGQDDEHILLVSDNEKYLPFPLHRSHIHSIALVIGVIRLE